jgi:2-oxo-3-hexenedioate decarboxylase
MGEREGGAEGAGAGEVVAAVAAEALALLGSGGQTVPFSRRFAGFGLEEAYAAVARVRALREAAGERPLGRKIGFTNWHIWATYGIDAPIWNYVYDSTVTEADSGEGASTGRIALGAMTEPLVEPEVMFHLAAAPSAAMSPAALLDCIDWVAPAFEVVFSVFPEWDMAAADATAGFGMHGALLVGGRLDATGDKAALLAALSGFTVTLSGDDGTRHEGKAANVLGGPLLALQQLLADIARYPASAPLQAGEIVTTGTLTLPAPARPGGVWTARFEGIGLTPLQLTLD